MDKYKDLRHFSSWEFDSPDLQGSGDEMDSLFLQRLDEAREEAGIPFTITSGFRTKKHNKRVKGMSNSAHLKGYGADISTPTARKRLTILTACLKVGFNRIGIMKNAIHVDDDQMLPSKVLWHYYK